MKRIRSGSGFAAVLLALVFTTLASAQATRTWVSGVGDDANPCSRTAPCKTFAGAISKTAAGGVIDCLDPGGFGAVTITKSILIDCTHVAGGVLVAGTNGIVINASTTDNVTIRHLYFDGLGSGLSGINILQAGNVHLENVNIVGFTVAGVSVNASTSVNLSIYDTTITDGITTVGGSVTGNGLTLTDSSGTIFADLHDVRIYHTNAGIQAGTNVSLNVNSSELSFNSIGISTTGGGTGVDVSNTEITYNSTAGAQAAPGGTIRLMGNMLKKNGIATNLNGGNIFTDGQNIVSGNASLGSTNGSTAKI
jgi:hypothetical protein